MNHTEPGFSLTTLLQTLHLTGEQTQLECKESTWQLPQDLWETVSAFSNTAGGTLLLGVAERGGRFTITGLTELERTHQTTAQTTTQTTARIATQELLGLLIKGKRLSQTQMDDLIVALCAEHPLKARELAQMMHRSARHLRDAYLSRLVREGRLQLSGSPNDPHVTYSTAKREE